MSTSSTTLRGTIYTLGHSQAKAEATLEQLMRHPRALLVDVRYQPVSRWNPQWNRASLAGRYGHRYVWDRRLGNIHYQSRDRGIQLAAGHQDAVREAAGLLCAGTSLVLLCACGDERTCHRSLVAKLIQDSLPVPTAAREVGMSKNQLPPTQGGAGRRCSSAPPGEPVTEVLRCHA
jgi:uncharacterized protein (DUF488 family)